MRAWLRVLIAISVAFVSGVIGFFGIWFLVARSGVCPPEVHTCDLPGMAGFGAGLLMGPLLAVAAGWITFWRLGRFVRPPNGNTSPPDAAEAELLRALPDWLRRSIAGATVGALVGALFPLAGLLMGTLTLVFGRVFIADGVWFGVRIMFGFAAAGAVVGLLRPFARATASRYLVGVLGAAIAGTFTLWTIAGPLREWGLTEIVFVASAALIAGLLIGRSLRNSPTEA